MAQQLTWHTPTEFGTWCQSLPSGYSVSVKHSHEPLQFEILDTVDHRLNRFGLCFLRSEQGNVLLASPETVAVDLVLEESRDIRYLQDDMSSDWRDRLLKPLSVRRLLVRGQCQVQQSVYEVRDDWQKWVGDVFEARWEKGGMQLALYHFTALRGFDELWETLLPSGCVVDAHFLTWGQWLELLGAYDEAALLKPVPNFQSSDSGKTVLSDLSDAALNFLSQNERGVLQQWDIDFLRAHRVVLRRLRAWLAVFKPVMSEADYELGKSLLKEQMLLCSPLRDSDMLLQRLEQWHEHMPKTRLAGLRALERRLHNERDEAYGALSAAWCSKRYQRDLKRIRQALCQPGPGRSVKRLVKRRLKRCFAEVQARLDDAQADMQEERVHDLRKAVKKLRYTMLLAEGCQYEFNPPKKMRKVQNLLGEFNDMCVQCEWMQARLDSGVLSRSERSAMRFMLEQVQARKQEIWTAVPALLDNYVLDPHAEPDQAPEPAAVE